MQRKHAIEVSEDGNNITITAACFNVAGLLRFDGTGESETAVAAQYFNAGDFDIVAVQEDFSYHTSLVDNLNGYRYQTNHSGNIPGGDGLNVFTKEIPIYNEYREAWKDAAGDLAEGDTLTPKGFMHMVLDLGNGIYVDFYNLHADAFDGEDSIKAREGNYRQLAALVQENYIKYDRPVIITGDFNQMLHTGAEGNSHMYEIFHENLQLKDAWVEIHNGGDYENFTKWIESGVFYWGEWDSVDKFLYKNGGGVEIEALDFDYNWVLNDAGARVSDHSTAEVVFRLTKTEDFVEREFDLEVVTRNPLQVIINMIKWILKDLFYVLSNYDQLFDLLKSL